MYVLFNLYRECYERALQIFQQIHGHKHSTVAAVLNNLGNTWLDLGDPAKSKELYEEALAIQEEIYGHDHPDVSHMCKGCMENNGYLCHVPVNSFTCGRWPMVEVCCRHCLRSTLHCLFDFCLSLINI